MVSVLPFNRGTERFDPHQIAHPLVRGVREEDLPRAREPLHSSRDVRRVTDGGEGPLIRRADGPDHGRTGVHTDPGTRPIRMFRRGRLRERLHRERSPGSPKGVVRLVIEGVEHRHDGVTSEPLDHAACSLDDHRDDTLPVSIEHLDHVRCGLPLTECGESDEIREQRGHVRFPASELAELGLFVQTCRELRADVGAEEVVDADELVGGALERCSLLDALIPSARKPSTRGASGSPDRIDATIAASESACRRSMRSSVRSM